MRFCHVCGSELAPDAATCPICGTAVTNQPTPQPQAPVPPPVLQAPMQQPVNTQPPKKEKKKHKHLALKITAAVLAFIILATGGLFLADHIMYKNEIEAGEYITDFPVLKRETDFVVFDEVNFPYTDYSIKVERVLYGGVLKSEMFKQTKIIIDDTSTDPVYHIDFEEDGEYIITLEDNTDKEENTTSFSTATDTDSMPSFSTATDSDFSTATDTDEDEDEDETPSKITILVTVEDGNKEAVGSVNLDSKPGDDPVEIPSDEKEPVTEPEYEPELEPETGVPSDAFEYNGHSYMLYKDVCSTWEEADEYCRSLGGYLAVISSQEENDALFSYITSDGNGNAYFGYSDNLEEGTWYWVEGDSSYTNWNPGEPSNQANNENYAMFYYKFTDGTWNDGNFDNGTVNDSRNFICEWDVQDSSNDYQDIPDDNQPSTDDDVNTTADWVTAYRDFLLNYEVDEYSGEYTVFSLCYIDSDDIPEIIIGIDPSYAAHAHGASVYTYYNGSVNFVCEGGQYGEIQYLEKGNMICGVYSGMGSIHNQTYEIQNGTGVCIWEGYNDRANVVEEEDATYESNGSVVTREEYDADSEQYYPYESLSTSGDYCSSLTEGNIYYYLSN